jgi:hypothetical protein
MAMSSILVERKVAQQIDVSRDRCRKYGNRSVRSKTFRSSIFFLSAFRVV